jgi:hypothetical protein
MDQIEFPAGTEQIVADCLRRLRQLIEEDECPYDRRPGVTVVQVVPPETSFHAAVQGLFNATRQSA